MYNFIQLQRIIFLLNKKLRDRLKTYTLIFLGNIALLIFVLGFIGITNHSYLNESKQYNVFSFFFLLNGCLLTSFSFSELRFKRSAIPYLTLPCSHFEKVTVAWFLSFILYQILFVIGFYIADSLVVFLISNTEKGYSPFLRLSSTDSKFYYLFLAFAALHAIYFLGAVHYNRLTFISTTIFWTVAVSIIAFINNLLLKSMIKPATLFNAPFDGLRFIAGGKHYHINADVNMSYLGILICFTVILLLWVSAYFSLKEKQF